MNTDKIISEAFNNKTSNMDISEEKLDEMINYIDGGAHRRNSGTGLNIMKRFGRVMSMVPLKDILEVALIIIIVIMIPTSVKYFKQSEISSKPNNPDVVAENNKGNEEIIGSGITKAYEVNTAIKSNNVVMISTVDSQGKEIKNEVYNIALLDDFIVNFNNGKTAKARIIKYTSQESKVWINKLEDIEFDGESLTHTGYNTYSKSDSTSEKPAKVPFYKINKITSKNLIRYALYEDKDTPVNMGMTLISFNADTSIQDGVSVTGAINYNLISPSVPVEMREKLLSRINKLKEMGPGVGPWRIIFYNSERVILYNYDHVIGVDITEKNNGIYSVLNLDGYKVGNYQGSVTVGIYPSPDGMACVIGTGCWEQDYNNANSLYTCNLYDSTIKEIAPKYNMTDGKVKWYENKSATITKSWYISIEGKASAVLWDFEKGKKISGIPLGLKEQPVDSSYVENIDVKIGYAYYNWWKKDENTVIGAPFKRGTNSTAEINSDDFELIEVNLNEKSVRRLYRIE